MRDGKPCRAVSWDTEPLRGAKPGGRGAANQGVRAHCRLQHMVLWGETLLRAVSTGQDGLQEGPAERKLF